MKNEHPTPTPPGFTRIDHRAANRRFKTTLWLLMLVCFAFGLFVGRITA